MSDFKETSMAKMVALLDECREFIARGQISCGEAIYQTDRVLEDAPEFIEAICEIVGYYPPELNKEP